MHAIQSAWLANFDANGIKIGLESASAGPTQRTVTKTAAAKMPLTHQGNRLSSTRKWFFRNQRSLTRSQRISALADNRNS
jgi:hypothetical protein